MIRITVKGVNTVQYKIISIILGFVIIVLSFISFYLGGWSLVSEAFLTGFGELFRVLPLLAAAFIIAGLMQVLITEELVKKWLGQEAGLKGVLLGWLAGSVIPGGPFVYYPVALSLLHSKVGIGTILAFILGKQLSSLERLIMEFPLLGSELTVIRFSLTFFFPPLIAIMTHYFFPGLIDKIREGAEPDA